MSYSQNTDYGSYQSISNFLCPDLVNSPPLNISVQLYSDSLGSGTQLMRAIIWNSDGSTHEVISNATDETQQYYLIDGDKYYDSWNQYIVNLSLSRVLNADIAEKKIFYDGEGRKLVWNSDGTWSYVI